ncbi:MAG: serine/threonine-protein phosphatase [Acidobacteria bacterium]|nr:serine/threonine-protein phosphatase [Acidobacteriota bacterium]
MRAGPIAIEISACTDVGLVRKNNEDYFLVVDLTTGQCLGDIYRAEKNPSTLSMLLAVSDGMGGQLAGEVASQLAINALAENLIKFSSVDPYDRLVKAVEDANYQVFREGQRPEYRGMGATLTAALVEGDQVYIAEVGDSRAYLMRDGRIKQVTTDQSLMEVLVARGLISQADAEKSSSRGILLQAMGIKEEIQVAVTTLPLQSNDYLLLCSDGLSNKVKASEIAQFIVKRGSTQPACQDMIVTARHRGGEDNITALLARFNGVGLPTKLSNNKITTTLQALSTFDPDRPKPKRRTQRLSSLSVADKAARFSNTVGGLASNNRNLRSYPRLESLMAEFERLSHHLDKATDSLRSEMEALRDAAEWLEKGGAVNRQLPEIFTKMRSAESTLDHTRKTVAEAKELLKKNN